ncbi:TPA: inovirus Gp2 family protein [Vibrio parahaemolyticus]|uniref:inovirus Gp2 family protein n=1 Tax=Vibrio TaxID=662 RepID=UPI00062BFF72|nr:MULTISPECIES: inovirus Gp2 family protein [Vibrio]EIO2937870.1 inovirus Gp2 family protein [Vibrio parahaemolyticus]EJE8526025.1 inovirus Gp2 family protein [Vibrio parahaemolyticus]EKD7164712.1 inovirus Gp2 family protein [Vibrio vulnificus]ELS9504442.1 inovirus Gp2 family protein [Vibrio parahaemolyticus]MCU8250458.1 inovirus Gp2 family protein [Vibrio vulnificus]
MNNNCTDKRYIGGMLLSCNSNNGPLDDNYLASIKRTFDYALSQYSRTRLMRFDLHYPDGYPVNEITGKQITKFQESFKAIMCAYIKRKKHNRHSKPRFIWCREIVTSEYPHYHVAVLLNGDVFQGMGPYDDITGEYISGMIAKAWASAIGLSVEQASRAIYFPNNGTYEINKRGNAETFYNQYNQAFYRVSYFAKLESKLFGNRGRNFDSSRH